MYIYIYMHIYIFIYKHIYKHVFISIYIHICICIHIYVCMYVYICIYIHTYTQSISSLSCQEHLQKSLPSAKEPTILCKRTLSFRKEPNIFCKRTLLHQISAPFAKEQSFPNTALCLANEPALCDTLFGNREIKPPQSNQTPILTCVCMYIYPYTYIYK